MAYLLTGETREYFPERGILGTVTPRRNFGLGKSRGPGAWEVTARISHIDLNDSFVHGGEATNYSLGLNWYMNPNFRVMWNYIHADIKVRTDFPLPNSTPTANLDNNAISSRCASRLTSRPSGSVPWLPAASLASR